VQHLLTDISCDLWLVYTEVLILLNQGVENFFFTPHREVAASECHNTWLTTLDIKHGYFPLY
tara:strand:- start:2579 stop:2764 length:186 start_codon:yes stop_codon:yes gene_type:complete